MKTTKLNTSKHSLPAIWASYLINSDPSGLDDKDIAQCDSEVETLGQCVEVSENTHFGTFKGMGYDLAEYTFIDPFVKVHFRKEDNMVFAYFPELPASPGFETCYAHIGQHSSCSAQYAFKCQYATLKESEDLIKELTEMVGYNLNIQVNHFFEVLNVEECKKEIAKNDFTILCGHYSINIQSKYYQDEGLDPEAMQNDWNEFENALGETMEVNDYDDLVVSTI